MAKFQRRQRERCKREHGQRAGHSLPGYAGGGPSLRSEKHALSHRLLLEPQAPAPQPWAGAACEEKKARVP